MQVEQNVPLFAKLTTEQREACRRTYPDTFHEGFRFYLVERLSFSYGIDQTHEIPAGFLFRGPPTEKMTEFLLFSEKELAVGWIVMEFFTFEEKIKNDRVKVFDPRFCGTLLEGWFELLKERHNGYFEEVFKFMNSTPPLSINICSLPCAKLDKTSFTLFY